MGAMAHSTLKRKNVMNHGRRTQVADATFRDIGLISYDKLGVLCQERIVFVSLLEIWLLMAHIQKILKGCKMQIGSTFLMLVEKIHMLFTCCIDSNGFGLPDLPKTRISLHFCHWQNEVLVQRLRALPMQSCQLLREQHLSQTRHIHATRKNTCLSKGQ